MRATDLNALGHQQAEDLYTQCCASIVWVERMVEGHPYESKDSLLRAASLNWDNLNQRDYLQAFEGHPQIGDLKSSKKLTDNALELASQEQTGMMLADEHLVTELKRLNISYEKKFGFIFIVCASGKSASQMLSILKDRLTHNRNEELGIAIEEQRKIFLIRLEKLL